MSGIAPIAASWAVHAADPALIRQAAPPQPTQGVSFSQMLMNGVDHVDKQLAAADAKVAAFAVDDTIPPHEVIYAIEQARHSLELVLQVRSHLVEGFQEIMRMQL